MTDDAADPLSIVLDYHERTKHRPERYARSLGRLDWASQPSPFRTYEGAPRIALAEVPPAGGPAWHELFLRGTRHAAEVAAGSIAQLLYDSLALSAWKVAGASRWSLRVNPSSGNLHPTEGWLVLPAIPALCAEPAVHHYAPFEHALETRRTFSVDEWNDLVRGLPESSFLVGLTSIVWRESWKYGERAFRYCQHDLGHAIGAIAIAASVLGWRVRVLDRVADDTIGRLLGIDDQEGIEAELPEALLVVTPGADAAPLDWRPDDGAVQDVGRRRSLGTPNVLSPRHHAWPVLLEVAAASRHRGVERRPPAGAAPSPGSPPVPGSRPARTLVRRRRSAIDLDGTTGIDRPAFTRALARLLPERGPAIWDALPGRPRIQLAVFVHRVDALAPGLYLFARDPAAGPELAPDGEPVALDEPGVGLLRLADADVRPLARMVACLQDIAADGAFAVAMLARFEPVLRVHGPSQYRRLHWEAGLVGQILYLEAEACGLGATGIGCFFDDAIHELLDLGSHDWQALYCFTVGAPLPDTRVQVAPAYEHRAR